MKILVQNLTDKITQKDLIKAAEEFGSVVSAVIVLDIETGKPNGNAYIEMASKEEAEAAIKGLKGLELKDAKLKAKEATVSTKPGAKPAHTHKTTFTGPSSRGGFHGKGGHLKGGGGAGRGR